MLSIFLIGVALSMDAFSISLSLGTQNLNKKTIYLTCIIVGLFHFFMPLLGVFLGDFILNIINIDLKFLLVIILGYLTILMYLDRNNEETRVLNNIFSILLFSLSVSLDSFSVGIGLKALSSNILACSFIFSMCAGLITYMGFLLGKYSLKLLKKKAKLIGIVILLIITMVNLCQILFNLLT